TAKDMGISIRNAEWKKDWTISTHNRANIEIRNLLNTKDLKKENKLHPQLGESFLTQEEFFEAIWQYGLSQGFTIRYGKVDNRNKEKEIHKRTILCSRKGISVANKEDDKPKRQRESKRYGCKYMYIIALQEIHNHAMIKQEELRFTQQERNLSENVKERVLLLRYAGCDVSQILSILKEEFSGEITWIYDDIYNFIYRTQELNNDEFDASEFIHTLKLIQEENPEFKFSYIVNSETNKLEHVIWMFTEQRIYYLQFNDIIVFDNTYQTNRFNMLFGIFTGVNNLEQSICFVEALISNETEASFTLIFLEFLKIVNMKAPQVLLTDDDKGISNAYNNPFYYYDTKHHLCQWHLLKNVMKNLISKLGNQWSNFIKRFYKCLEECDQITFNEMWNFLKNDYSKAVAYLVQMKKTVNKWAACYNHNIFMADMTTTQRGESMNHLMKGYMDATTSLLAFIQAFETALDSCKEYIELEIYRQDNNNITFQTTSLYEKQAAHFLTKYALRKTQEQLIQSFNYKCKTTDIALKKTRNKDGTFVAKVTNEIKVNMDTLEDWELFKITHEIFHDYALKAIEWHENADKKLKSTFYTSWHT
ncbi:3059_t:CDS:2, partial [Gigaspora margarita]